MTALEKRARSTLPRMLQSQRNLRMPAWNDVKPCPPDLQHEGRYLFIAEDWGLSRRKSASAPCVAVPAATPKTRMRSKGPDVVSKRARTTGSQEHGSLENGNWTSGLIGSDGRSAASGLMELCHGALLVRPQKTAGRIRPHQKRRDQNCYSLHSRVRWQRQICQQQQVRPPLR